jgi:hypothetical protein
VTRAVLYAVCEVPRAAAVWIELFAICGSVLVAFVSNLGLGPTLCRNEKSGALSGLTRVRKFHQDDAHIFCRPDQIADEVRHQIDWLPSHPIPSWPCWLNATSTSWPCPIPSHPCRPHTAGVRVPGDGRARVWPVWDARHVRPLDPPRRGTYIRRVPPIPSPTHTHTYALVLLAAGHAVRWA